jgi:hypothetical protein
MRQKVMEKTIEMRNEIETTKECLRPLVKLNVYSNQRQCYFKESIDTNVGVVLNLENSSLVLGIGYFLKLTQAWSCHCGQV